MVWRSVSVLAVVVMSAACASGPFSPQVVRNPAPLRLTLALAPDALGCSVAVQQQLMVQAPGQPTQALDALLEVDAHNVRLALFHMGQRMGILLWDGQQLQTQLSRWWPAQLPPAQVLSDMQLALWPASAVVQALPEGWVLEEKGQGPTRHLAFQGQERITIQAVGAQAFDIRYAPAAWQLHVASPGGMQPCVGTKEAP
jgi:hypothetical protein